MISCGHLVPGEAGFHGNTVHPLTHTMAPQLEDIREIGMCVKAPWGDFLHLGEFHSKHQEDPSHTSICIPPPDTHQMVTVAVMPTSQAGLGENPSCAASDR